MGILISNDPRYSVEFHDARIALRTAISRIHANRAARPAAIMSALACVMAEMVLDAAVTDEQIAAGVADVKSGIDHYISHQDLKR